MSTAAALTGFALDDPIHVLYDKHSRSQQPESKRVISVLLAICSVINEKKLNPSPVSVYAATMASLTSVLTRMPAATIFGGGRRREANDARDADDIGGRVGTFQSQRRLRVNWLKPWTCWLKLGGRIRNTPRR